ncbi:MAG: FAD-dependent oxidoreductase [Bacteroidia bacterium]|nr:FAD-dependent oxidoreductase [Bacteroidia bacterium]
MSLQEDKTNIAILGGGPAGLSAGYYARKNQLDFTLYEASEKTGGNAVTFKSGDFYYDSGAHRFHDKIPEVTNEVKSLMGDSLKEINVPSQIYNQGKYLDFPISPLNVIKNLGIRKCLSIGTEVLGQRSNGNPNNFKSVAINKYGKTLAELFLLNYSEKLWGIPPDQLSVQVSGKRLKGLTIKTLLKELIGSNTAKTKHLDGSFYYPDFGIGQIMDCLAEKCSSENIKLNKRVSKIRHENFIPGSIEFTDGSSTKANQIISTLPISILLEILEPAPPTEILSIARDLKFRNIKLVAFFIDKKQISNNASLYFPDAQLPFTRIYEPRNRSVKMAPKGKTSLIVEIPCFDTDQIWNENDHVIIERIKSQLIQLSFIEEKDIINAEVQNIKNAYPVLERDVDEKLTEIQNYLCQFKNLHLIGRSGTYKYNHIHDLLYSGKMIINNIM